MSIEKTILFDEHGTPTFRTDRESKFFIGVGVTLETINQDEIFSASEDLFGLKNSHPVKNRKLSISRINNIGTLLAQLPIYWTIILIDLSNEDLKRVVTLYEEYSNLLRTIHRGVRDRPIAQILYKQLVDHVLFSAIQNAIELDPKNTRFSIFLDNWAFSRDDLKIVLDLNRKSMEKHSNDVTNEIFNVNVSLDDFEILVNDSTRKRFIDVVTSTTSRAYLDSSDGRYSGHIKSILNLKNNHWIYIDDITNVMIKFFVELMDQTARGREK